MRYRLIDGIIGNDFRIYLFLRMPFFCVDERGRFDILYFILLVYIFCFVYFYLFPKEIKINIEKHKINCNCRNMCKYKYFVLFICLRVKEEKKKVHTHTHRIHTDAHWHRNYRWINFCTRSPVLFTKMLKNIHNFFFMFYSTIFWGLWWRKFLVCERKSEILFCFVFVLT